MTPEALDAMWLALAGTAAWAAWEWWRDDRSPPLVRVNRALARRRGRR